MKKETQDWLKIAQEDYRCAQALFKEKIFRMVCFHCQQAVEKALKAFLTEKEIDFKRIHNLIDLKRGIEKLRFKIFFTDEDAVFLNSVYRMRYPADLGLLPYGEPIIEDAEKALKIAETVLKHVVNLL